MERKSSRGLAIPCDGRGRGGTCQSIRLRPSPPSNILAPSIIRRSHVAQLSRHSFHTNLRPHVLLCLACRTEEKSMPLILPFPLLSDSASASLDAPTLAISSTQSPATRQIPSSYSFAMLRPALVPSFPSTVSQEAMH